jgi:hypothetical protein
LNEEINFIEIIFASIANFCSEEKLLEELSLEKENLVSCNLKVCKELASEKVDKLPERYIFSDKSSTLSFVLTGRS